MSFYEVISIIRQDVASSDVDLISDDFKKVISENGGQVVKEEYWGLRNLAYEINKNRKGHYIMLVIEANNEVLKELERKASLNGDIIRYLAIKSDSASSEPSPILKGKSFDNDVIVDVTLNK